MKSSIKAAGKLKGRERELAIGRVERKNLNNVNSLLMGLETSILTKEEENDHIGLMELKREYEEF